MIHSWLNLWMQNHRYLMAVMGLEHFVDYGKRGKS